jgi:signal transduction histidine kinase
MHFSPWRGWLFFGVALVMAAGVTIIISLLWERVDECRRVQTDLAFLQADAYELDTLQGDAFSMEKLDKETVEHMEQIRTRTHERLNRLGLLRSSLPKLDELTKKYKAYVLLTDQVFKLIDAGNIKEAQQFDATKEDPAFDALKTELEESGNAYDKTAVHLLGLVRAGIFLMLLCGVGVIAGLMRQFNKKRQMVEVAAAEQRALNQANEKLESRVRERTAELSALNQQMENRITERTAELAKTNEALFQSQKLETVGKLAGGIAHEFNSILTVIIGQSELLLEDLPAGSPLAKGATEICKVAERAATLTRQLLAYGRKQILQPAVLDLNSVLAGMENTLRHVLGPDTDVHIAFTGVKPVRADAGQIEQVIMNMVLNARDAMPNGGKLTLETANVSFDPENVGRYPELKPGNYVMLAIADTGAGMSEEIKARVFEPFFTTKDIGQGTGLGLSTCYGIIKQSDGHISVDSEPGRGTIFKIYLPQVEPQRIDRK